MTRKHFTAIAAVLLGHKSDDPATEIARRKIAVDLAGELRRFNPHFDTQRFLTAAGAYGPLEQPAAEVA